MFPKTVSVYLIEHTLIYCIMIVAISPARIYTILSTFASILLFAFFFLTIHFKAHGESNSATVSTNEFLPEGALITQSLIDSAMPELKQSQLGKILTRYYKDCLGGADHWKAIRSFRVSAELNTANGIENYESIFKKPNFYKIAISSEDRTNIVAFDGNNKWRKQISGEEWSYPEIAPQMRRMIHEPELATYLLYPLQTGKTYQYNGTVRENNTVCFKVSLLTKQKYLIDYFIDVESYCIVSIKIIDKLKEFSPVLIKYSDHRLVDGVYFAHKIKYHIDGEWDSTLEVKEIDTNVGAANWMFHLKNDSL